jgi:hypothetical protein
MTQIRYERAKKYIQNMIDGSWSELSFEVSGAEWAQILRNIANEIED